MGSFKAKITLENRSKVPNLLDISVEINVMTREVMEDASLAMQHGPKLELVSYTGHSSFFGLCEDVEVSIEGLKTRCNIRSRNLQVTGARDPSNQ